jgi:hypothetical protein
MENEEIIEGITITTTRNPLNLESYSTFKTQFVNTFLQERLRMEYNWHELELNEIFTSIISEFEMVTGIFLDIRKVEVRIDKMIGRFDLPFKYNLGLVAYTTDYVLIQSSEYKLYAPTFFHSNLTESYLNRRDKWISGNFEDGIILKYNSGVTCFYSDVPQFIKNTSLNTMINDIMADVFINKIDLRKACLERFKNFMSHE